MNFLLNVWNTTSLRDKILFTVVVLVIYRILAHITVPGVDTSSLVEMMESDDAGALGVYSLITGGSLENFSIVMMGLAPYINASIIMQLMTVVVPKLESLSKEGDAGRKKISQYTRYLAVVFAFLQSYGFIVLLGESVDIDFRNIGEVLPVMFIVTAGTILLMWFGELITERGIGNGISLIILASLIAAIPDIVGRIFGFGTDVPLDTQKVLSFLAFVALSLVLTLFTVVATEGKRRIPVTYGTGGKNSIASEIPIRVLQAGMIPIIFALSLVTFPTVMVQIISQGSGAVQNPVVQFIIQNFDPSNGSFIFYAIYFLLIVFFSFFYVSITFKTDQVAENIQKRGGFVPGYRPGTETAKHLSTVSTRLNVWGGSFLGLVAIVPMIFVGFSDSMTSSDMVISGSGIVIIVGVVLDLIRRVNSQLVMHDYDKLK